MKYHINKLVNLISNTVINSLMIEIERCFNFFEVVIFFNLHKQSPVIYGF
jgi:hypothetical protein